MAELNVKLITDANQSVEAFKSVSTKVKSYRDELLEASSVQKASQKSLDDYLNSLRKAMNHAVATKDGMAALKAEAKMLKEEIFQLNGAWGKENDVSKVLDAQLKMVEKDMEALDASSKKFAKGGMAEVEKTSGSTATKLLSVAKNILKFQLLMGPITGAIRGFKNTLSDSVKLAAEAEQRFSKLATVFDGMADSAKAMSQSLAGSLGVANSTAASALSTVGDLLQAQGMGTAESLTTSANWIQQFQDIIAFKDINMSLEEFAQNFMSGAAGNLRNFRTFGSIVKESAVNARLAAEGYDKLTGSQLELAKMTARAEIALEQQKNAIGATEREWDTMLSINRRLNEAWKEYKENLGDTINSALKPLKSWWTQVLEQINKANKAKKEFEAGNEDIGVYDVANNSADADKFVAAVSPLISNFYSVEKNLDQYSDLVSENIIKPLDDELVKFSASVETLNKLFDNKLPQVLLNLLAPYENARNARIKAKKDSDARGKTYLSALESFDSFQEVLLGIKGVSFTPYDFSANAPRNYDSYQAYASSSQDRLQSVLNIMGTKTAENITDAFTSLKDSPLEKWGDIIMSQLEDFDMEGLFKAKMETVAELFTAVWNEAWKDGIFDDEEKGRLEDIKKYYHEINADLEKYIANQNLIAAYNSGLSSLSSSATGYNRQLAAVGLSDLDAGLLELSYAFEDMKAQFSTLTQDELKELGIDLDKLDEEYGKQVEAYKKLYDAQQTYAAMLEAQSAVSGLVTGAQGRLAKNAFVDAWNGHSVSFYNGTTTTLNMAQAGALYDYRQNWDKVKGYLGRMTPNAAGQYDLGNGLLMTFDEIDHVLQDDLLLSFKDLAEAVEDTASEFWKQYNPFQGTVDAYNAGKNAIGGVGGGFLGILMELLKQTEAFSELTNIVSETIVPILDAILRPLIPVLKVIETMFDVLSPLLEPLFAVIKVIATAVIEILTPIRLIFAAVNNILERIKHPITGGDRIAYKDILSETNELLKEMWDAELDIKRNTENKDLKLLESLRDRNIISTEQFYKEAGAIQGTYTPAPTTASYYPYESQSSANQSHAVQIGSLTFNLPQGDPEENARAIARMLKRLGIDIDVSAVSYA